MPTPADLPPLLHWLNDKLDVAVRAQPLREGSDLLAFRMDLSRFRLRLSEHTPCLVVPATLIQAHTPIQLKRQIMDTLLREGWLRRNTLVLADGDASSTDELKVLCRSETLPPLILDAAAQHRILAGPANSNALIDEISRQAPLTALSVYETSAPVQGAQFFGRESELRDILQKSTTSFLIFGNRRMGKTSLVREVLRRMRHEARSDSADGGSTAQPTQLYFDCSIFRNKEEFYAEVIRELDGPREIERLYRDKSFSMVSFLQRMYRARREKIVLCLDEVDHLLAWDALDNWQVIATLRALAATSQTVVQSAHGDRGGGDRGDDDRQPLRVIMAGFRMAQAWAENKDTPLFNFASLMRVTNFDHRTTEQLVAEPMFNLGLTLVDRSALVNRIFRETGGHPNLIQHYCDFIVRRLDQTGSREVTPKLLDDVLNDSALRSRVTDELMANASNLEQFIIFSFIHQADAPDRFTLSQADGWLKAREVELPRSDLEHALTALETSGMLVRDGKQYGFAFSVLRRMLSENWDVDYQLRKILEEGVV